MTKTLFTGNRVVRRLVVSGALVFLSCGIFSPRDTELPVPPGRTDALNFAAIMAGTGYQFTKLQYEDLFGESVVYTDLNSGTFYKNQLIQKVLLIQRQNPVITVTWTSATPIWKPNDTIYLNGLSYNVYVGGDTLSAPDAWGNSDFIVVRESSDWHICMWRDTPGSQGKSFFSPP